MSRESGAIHVIADLLRGKVDLDATQARILASPAKTIRVTARAGSGKTRLLKAMAYFLVKHCGYSPNEILLLAFNRDAAESLEKGLVELLGVPSFPSARTFHSLAYGIVRPEASLVFNQGPEIGAMQLTALVQDVIREILGDDLREQVYRMFREETKNDLMTGALLHGSAHYDFRRAMAQVTLGGATVKSQGEKFIGDFLFEHGIEHYYEQPVPWEGRWYRPDFTIRHGGAKIILEHWAEDPDREELEPSVEWPLQKLRQYQETSRQKRAFWKEKGIPLVETCAFESADRPRFEAMLYRRLTPHLGKLSMLPDVELHEKVVKIHLSTLAQWVAQAIQRTQKQRWDVEALQSAIHAHGKRSERESLFLKLVAQTFSAYDGALKRKGKTDFDRVLNEAIAMMRGIPPQTVIVGKDASIDLREIKICLVDEAQDLSLQFKDMLVGIRAVSPSARLVLVGDDWQAINRFAGSSVEIFTDEITTKFGQCATPALTTNYRSAPGIVNAGNSVMEGRGQPATASLTKPARIERACFDTVWVEYRKDGSQAEGFLRDAPFKYEKASGAGQLLKSIYQLAMGDLAAGKTVGVLFRTNRCLGMAVEDMRSAFLNAIRTLGCPKESVERFDERIRFSTAHKFKGGECDTVFVVSPHTGTFPLVNLTSIELFQLFGDTAEKAEEDERRLFYVAMTRARERLVFLCESARASDSPFLDPIESLIMDIPIPDEILRPKSISETNAACPPVGSSESSP